MLTGLDQLLANLFTRPVPLVGPLGVTTARVVTVPRVIGAALLGVLVLLPANERKGLIGV